MFDLNRDGLARGEPIEPREAVHPSVPVPDVVGKSAAMREPLQTAARVGPKDVTILIRGETGTGKELIDSRVHAESTRASAPLAMFNCGAIPVELAEAEPFGHAPGSPRISKELPWRAS